MEPGWQVDDAMAFSGPTSVGLRHGKEVGEIPAMPTLWYAGGSTVSGAYQHEEV
jgi:hypothetical protein